MRRSASPLVLAAVFAGLCTVAALDATFFATPADCAFGSPVLERGRVLLGINGRSFTRDVYDIRRDRLSNPEDSFSYVALESRVGVFRDRIDFGIEVGRAHNKQDRYPDRDYLTWDLGLGLRGLIFAADSGRFDITAGASYRETIGYDRSSSQTHKLQRNYVGYLLFGRRTAVYERPLRIYVGPLYSAHDFEEYGESYSEVREEPAHGETRNNVLLLAGASVRPWEWLEVSGEVEFRETFSFGWAAGYLF